MPLILPPEPVPDFPVVDRSAPLPARLRGGAIAIGNFDGVHLGHKAVIGAALRLACAEGRPALVLTFEPHPRAFFRPQAPTPRIAAPATKIRLLAGLGLDGVAVAAFDAAFAALSAEEFEKDVLAGWLHAAHVVVGPDFCYGAGRAGTVATLAARGRALGFAVTPLGQVSTAGVAVSSTAIRDALARGDIAAANAMLGHAWFVTGQVVHGDKRGRTLGYPTANVRLDPAPGLAHGIYAVKLGLDGRWHDGVASFGRRPTFDNGAPLLEAHVFDFSGDLYGRTVDIAFAGYIRAELKFGDIGALIAQMDRDSAAARAMLAA